MTIGCRVGIIASSYQPPQPIAGMIAWYDINNLNSVYSVKDTTQAQNGNDVVHVRDISFNNNDAITIDSNKAGVLNTTGINSMPAIECIFSYLQFENPTLFDTITGITVFIVGTSFTNNGGHPIRVNASVLYNSTSRDIYESLGFNARTQLIKHDVPSNTPYVYAVTGEENENTELYINNAYNNIYSASYGNGYRTLTKNLFNHLGFVGEIQIFNSKLTDNDFVFKYNSLMTKWGIVYTTITTMIAWYDISNLRTVYSVKDTTLANNGDDVVQIKDLSYNDNDAIATGSNIAGVLNTTGINSMPVIDCNMGNLVFENPTLFDSITGITVFIVGTSASTNTGHPISLSTNILVDNIDKGIYENLGFSTTTNKITHSLEHDESYVYAITGEENGTTEVYMNNAINNIYTGDYGGDYRTAVKTLFNHVGLVGEIQIFNSKLSSDDFIIRFNALKMKWKTGKTIQGMIAWYDISKLGSAYSVKDTTLAQEGNNVLQVIDISYNNNDAIRTGSSIAGVYRTSGINSMPAIECILNNLVFENPTLFDTITGITVFIVGTSFTNNVGHPVRLNADLTFNRNVLFNGSNRDIYEHFGFSQRTQPIQHSVPSNTPYVYAVTGGEGEGGTTEIYINDVNTHIHSDSYGNNYRTLIKNLFNHQGFIGEIQIFSSKLDNADFVNRFNALKTKWGIS